VAGTEHARKIYEDDVKQFVERVKQRAIAKKIEEKEEAAKQRELEESFVAANAEKKKKEGGSDDEDGPASEKIWKRPGNHI